MAKAKRSAEDLDAELAALEAELAALETKKKAPKAKAPPAPAPAPAPGATPAPAAPEPKRKLPGFGRKKEAPRAPPAPALPAAPAPRPATPGPSYDASLWRRDGDAWVRTVPGKPRVVRRVLDEDGNVVREEPADAREVEDVGGVKAERGAGKLLGRFRR